MRSGREFTPRQELEFARAAAKRKAAAPFDAAACLFG
jgi:hypothetical protein